MKALRVLLPIATSLALLTFAMTSVLAQTPDFSLSQNLGSLTISPGSIGSSTVGVSSLNGFSGNVTLRAAITTLPSGLGLAVNPDTNKIYTGSAVVDGTSNTLSPALPVGRDVAANPATNRLYVSNFGSNTTSVIDASSNSLVTTIDVGFEPAGVAVNANTNRIYVANSGDGTVSVIDGSTNSVVGTTDSLGLCEVVHPHPPCPDSVAVNPTTNRVYAESEWLNTVWVIDGTNASVIAQVVMGAAPGVTSGIHFGYNLDVNPSTNRIYAANGKNANTTTVIDGSTNSVIASIAVGADPTGVKVNPVTNRVYVVNLLSNTVSVVDGSSNSVVAVVHVGSQPNGIGGNPNTNMIYVTNSGSLTTSAINGTSNTVLATFTRPKASVSPTTVTLAPGGTATSTLSVSTFANTTLGKFNVNVTGSSSSLNHAVTVLVFISRTTATAVSCASTVVEVNHSTSCTASVTDASSGVLITPSSEVTFTSSGAGTFSPAPSCVVFGTGGTAACSVLYIPAAVGVGTHNIEATYSGDPSHSNSSSGTPFSLTVNFPGLLGQYWKNTFLGDPIANYSSPIPPASIPSPTVTDLNVSFGASIMPVPFQWHPFGYNSFSVRWTGFLNASTAGTYTFNLTSDDGSWLFVDSSLVVNDGLIHSQITKSGTKFLDTGLHPIQVEFFEEGTGSSGVDFYWKPPGATGFVAVPSGVLEHGLPDFSLSTSSPPPVTVGSPAISEITLTTMNGFIGTVVLADTQPPGLSCGAINPGNTTLLSSPITASLSCSSTMAGTFNVAVTGASGSLNHSATILVTVKRTTTTSINCAGMVVVVSHSISCTAIVTDTSPGTAITPTDAVNFATSGAGSFAPAGCALSGMGATSTCSVSYTPTVVGSGVHNIATSYSGDPSHSNSSSATPFSLTVNFPGLLGQYWNDTFFGATVMNYSSPIAPSSIPNANATDLNVSFGASTVFNWHPFGYNSFSVRWTGFLNASTAGTYTFNLTSDDGSWLFVDSSLVVNDGGLHGYLPSAGQPKTGTSLLSVGLHRVEVDFFEDGTGSSGIDLYWRLPGASVFALVPSTVFEHGLPDIIVSASSPAPVNVGSQAVSTITLSATNGFIGTVVLTGAFPSELGCGTITPSSITLLSSTSTATLSCTSTISGTYKVTLTITIGALVHSANATFTFTSGPVGGIPVPVEKLALLAPFIGLGSVVMFATALGILGIRRYKKRHRGTQ